MSRPGSFPLRRDERKGFTLLELLIVVMGGLVLIIVLSIFMPIFQMAGGMKAK